jgi:hypothetical protein
VRVFRPRLNPSTPAGARALALHRPTFFTAATTATRYPKSASARLLSRPHDSERWTHALITDLAGIDTAGPDGVVWSFPPGDDLNANLVKLGPGGRVDRHRNAEVDVVIVVVEGAGGIRRTAGRRCRASFKEAVQAERRERPA